MKSSSRELTEWVKSETSGFVVVTHESGCVSVAIEPVEVEGKQENGVVLRSAFFEIPIELASDVARRLALALLAAAEKADLETIESEPLR